MAGSRGSHRPSDPFFESPRPGDLQRLDASNAGRIENANAGVRPALSADWQSSHAAASAFRPSTRRETSRMGIAFLLTWSVAFHAVAVPESPAELALTGKE